MGIDYKTQLDECEAVDTGDACDQDDAKWKAIAVARALLTENELLKRTRQYGDPKCPYDHYPCCNPRVSCGIHCPRQN